MKPGSMDSFFGRGNYEYKSSNYFTYKNLLDKDTIVLETRDIRRKGTRPFLVISESKVIELHPSQIRRVHREHELGTGFFLVRLNRNECREDFNRLVSLAKTQNKKGKPIALGNML